MNVRYGVYRRKDDFPVAISKNRVQCAMAMGISVESFDSYVSRICLSKKEVNRFDYVCAWVTVLAACWALILNT